MKQGIKEKDIKDFEKYAHKLNDVVKRIRAYKPDANVYLAVGSSLNLISCSCQDKDLFEQQENIVASVSVTGFDGGAW